MSEYIFSNNWFDHAARPIWDQLIARANPRKMLEVGSYEGASACYFIDKSAPGSDIELHCVDTWSGSVEHEAGGNFEADMNIVEKNFRHNIDLAVKRSTRKVNLFMYKQRSDECLSSLLASGKGDYFDFVYIDGSHQAPDVLCDAVLGFRLLAVGGIMGFDDYLWSEALPQGLDPLRCPKPAIDAFVNLYARKLEIFRSDNYQLYVRKRSN